MVQCFKATNLDKREYVCPWCINEGATLRQWAVGHLSGVLSLLLCNSSLDREDVDESPAYVIASGERPVIIAKVSHKSIFKDERPTSNTPASVIGPWSGDRICLVGEDDANLQYVLPSYSNITEHLIHGMNDFMSSENAQLRFRHCGCGSVNDVGVEQP